MADERTNLSDFEATDAYCAAHVSLHLRHCREAKTKVLNAKVDPRAVIQIALGSADRNTIPVELVLEPFDEPPALEAYEKFVARVLDALEDYLTVAVLEKEKELLRDYNIDPHR